MSHKGFYSLLLTALLGMFIFITYYASQQTQVYRSKAVPPFCETITNQTNCSFARCFWNPETGTCGTVKPVCFDMKSPATCEANSCGWNSDLGCCGGDPPCVAGSPTATPPPTVTPTPASCVAPNIPPDTNYTEPDGISVNVVASPKTGHVGFQPSATVSITGMVPGDPASCTLFWNDPNPNNPNRNYQTIPCSGGTFTAPANLYNSPGTVYQITVGVIENNGLQGGHITYVSTDCSAGPTATPPPTVTPTPASCVAPDIPPDSSYYEGGTTANVSALPKTGSVGFRPVATVSFAGIDPNPGNPTTCQIMWTNDNYTYQVQTIPCSGGTFTAPPGYYTSPGKYYEIPVRAVASSGSPRGYYTTYVRTDCAGGPTATPTPQPGASPTPTPFVTSTPPPGATPTPTPGGGGRAVITLNLSLTFQGIIQTPAPGENSMSVSVTLAGGPQGQSIPSTGTFTANSSGKWTGQVAFNDVAIGGSYRVLVKGPKHIQKKVCDTSPTETFPGTYHCGNGNITVSSSGVNTLDFSGIKLLVGDLPAQDGIIDAYDISLVRNNFCTTGNPNVCKDPKLLSEADLNLDGIIDSQDYSLLIASLSVKYDEK